MANIGGIEVKASDVMQNLTVTVRVIKDWRFRVCFALLKLAAWISSFVVETEDDSDVREKLADHAHEQWSGWMEYLFSKCQANDDGTVTMPAWAVERWQRQMHTPYADLSEQEKDSDRKEADNVLALLGYDAAD